MPKKIDFVSTMFRFNILYTKKRKTKIFSLQTNCFFLDHYAMFLRRQNQFITLFLKILRKPIRYFNRYLR